MKITDKNGLTLEGEHILGVNLEKLEFENVFYGDLQTGDFTLDVNNNIFMIVGQNKQDSDFMDLVYVRSNLMLSIPYFCRRLKEEKTRKINNDVFTSAEIQKLQTHIFNEMNQALSAIMVVSMNVTARESRNEA